MKTKVNEIPLVGPKGRSELIKKINETNENVDSKFKVLEEVLGIDLSTDIDEKYYQYFTIEVTQDGTTIYFRQSSFAADGGLDPLKVEVSYNKINWIEITAATSEDNVPGAVLAELDKGDKVFIRGRNEAYGCYIEDDDIIVENCNFYADKPCYVYGNIMSLVGGDDFARLRKVKEYAFASFFNDYEAMLDWSWVLSKEGEELLLPATVLASSCYNAMFNNCSSLATAPALPATTLAEGCYQYMFCACGLTSAPELPATTLTKYCYRCMFQSCLSLTTPPKLPATTLADDCYYQMFQSCYSLTIAPELSAMALTQNCYSSMFKDCESLTAAPTLPATKLVNNCYYQMFQGCTNLSYIKAMFTTTPSTIFTRDWVQNVKATGTFVKNSTATWNVTGNNGVPTGWTVQTADS